MAVVATGDFGSGPHQAFALTGPLPDTGMFVARRIEASTHAHRVVGSARSRPATLI